MHNETRQMIDTIRELSRNMITESMIFSEEDMPQDEDYVDAASDEELSDFYGMDDNNDGGSADIQGKINSIRRMALEGVTMLANNPTSPEYEFFKKIFMDCDKLFTSKEKPKQQVAQ